MKSRQLPNKGRTEILSGTEAQEYIGNRLREMEDDSVCAVFMADIDNTPEIREKLGREAEEDVRKKAGQILSSLFYASDIVSCIGRDEYLIFAFWDAGKEQLEKKAEQVRDSLCFEAGEDPVLKVSACVGAYMGKGKELTFDAVFGRSAAALYAAKTNGPGEVCVLANEAKAQAHEEAERHKPSNAIPMNTLLECLDVGVALVEAGDAIRLLYASHGFYRMLGLPRDAWELPRDLEDIGIHPDYVADYRQFLIDSVKKDGISSHIHRISGNGKDWVWRNARVARVSYPASSAPVLLEISTDVSNVILAERKLLESSDRLRVAFRQTPHVLWEVDISAGTYNIFNVDEQQCSPATVIEGFPDAFLEKGIVHPDSAEDFLKFASEMLGGKKGDSANFILRDPSGRWYGWVAMSYLMMYDADGAPLKAIGIQSKLPDVSGIGPGIFPRRPLPETLRRHLIIRLRANVTEDYIDEVWREGKDQTGWTWGKTYTEIIADQADRLFSDSERMDFREYFSRDNLLDAYEKGRLWAVGEFRRVDGGGHIRWTMYGVNLARDPATDAVYLFACFSDCQKRHEWEQEAGGEMEREPGTGLYAYPAAKKLSAYLMENGAISSCALSLIRLVGLEEEREENGTAGESRKFIAEALFIALGNDCIVGSYRPDMVYVFFPDAKSRYEVKRKIEDAFAYARVSMESTPWMEKVRFVAGTVLAPCGSADLETLMFRAGYLCEKWKNSAMDTVAFPGEDEDWAWAGLRSEEASRGTSVPDSETDRALTREEQKVAFRCVTDMLRSGSLEASLMGALRCIGVYYRAARVYMLALSDDRQTVTMQHEWTEWGRQSIRYVMSGVQISQIPLLLTCLEEKKPIRMESSSLVAAQSQESGKWHFTVCPLKKNNEVTGFLCVENPQEHYEDAALPVTLLPYIAGEQKRFETMSDRRNLSGYDALTMLPNLSSYMDVIYSLDSDVYSSMGALSLDIPDFSTINSTFGFEYGRKLLIYISDALLNIFRSAYVFRTWDAEFVVLYPNTIQEVFNGRCARLRTMIQRRYPRQVRLGSVWSDGIFSARNLVREAQTVMRSEHVGDQGPGGTHPADSALQTDRSGFAKQRFVPYYQPKIDMRNGSLAGAEALARAVDREGNILPPSQFIERLEDDGSIRDLDLFMLDSVLQQLAKWQSEGRPLVRVSINISRVTLFSPTILASVLAIQSRYPNLPSDLIEFEITETGGEMEKATLAGIVDEFREFGLKFELDDFGSGYANISVFSNIRFDTVKLDRTLVNDLPGNEISSILVENITQICHNFGMKCIAEGVETQQQEMSLLKAGCIYGQGFYYAKPLSAEEFEKRYLEGRTVPA